MKRFRLKDMNITRVDLVDRGAAPDAHILFAKSDSFTPPSGKLKPKKPPTPAVAPVASSPAPKPKPKAPAKKPGAGSALQSFRESGLNKPATEPKVGPPPMPGALGRPPGSGSRIVRIAPTDFEVTRMDGNMMEWAVPPDKLPEGVEEAIVTMVQSGDQVTFQWMIDPLAGPPVEGTANTAAEAFVAMRGGLTNTSAMDPMQMLGGFPSQMPAVPGMGAGKPGLPPAAGMGGSPKLPSVRKHFGPGPHANGTAQAVHAGGSAQSRAVRGAKDEKGVFDALDVGDKFKSGPRNPVRSREGGGSKMFADWKNQADAGAGNDFPFSPGTGDVSRRLRRERRVRAERAEMDAFERDALPVRASNPEAEDIAAGGTGKVRAGAYPDGRRANRYSERGRHLAKAAKAERQLNQTVDGVLDTVVKGLIETDIFVDTATGTDLRDILPENLLAELTNKLSATRAPRIS